MRFLSFFALFLSIFPCLAAPLHVDGTRFRNEEGRQVLLRGISIGGNSKVPPFRAIRGDKDFTPLRGWGFNTVRLLFNWEAFEPEPEVYNWHYLNYYRDMIDWAQQHDLYVIVAIHQDGFSRYSLGGCGAGFPKWTLPPFLSAATPDNGEKCRDWGLRMLFDIPLQRAWHHFYANTWGVRDRYLAMVRLLAERVANAPNLIGMDLLNEPWGMEHRKHSLLNQEAGTLVQSIIPDTLLFMNFPSTLPQSVFTTKWNFWPHSLNSGKSPMFIGEFGAPATMPWAQKYLSAVYDGMDQELFSGVQWVYTPAWNAQDKDGWNQEDFSINNEQGQLRGSYQPRPFLEETPGNLLSMRWNESNKTLSVVYEPTLYPEQLRVSIPAQLQWIGVEVSDRAQHCALVTRSTLGCESVPVAEEKTRTMIFLFK